MAQPICGRGHPGDLGMAVGGHDRLARGVHLGRADFDQAHAAIAGNGELGVVTIMRDEFADAARDFNGVEALGKLHPDAVDLHVEQRRVGGRTVVIERIFHRIEEVVGNFGTTGRLRCAGPVKTRRKGFRSA